ncbi:hypothetical protein P280DRAFT_466945 [Massarina eburnea CBS 473.64]|uniref:Uncharacterized protein n=1 Tax=Massarina eburnea CBS 473.64 TaxID=1395130 RepID=A0A6A6S9N2_9PLEO|nr:hypothetical protein P280DRAFT_466945 [Massarina eburnea CBS 473.64]
MRKLNQRCSYTELLRHYCPIEVTCTILSISTKLTRLGCAFILTAGMEEECTSAN